MCGLKSKYVDDVIISTDDEKIAEEAVRSGAENPFLRPAELASDTARAIDAFIYTIKRLKEDFKREYETLLILQPTSPLRDYTDVDEAIEFFYSKKALSVISVKEADTPLEWYQKVDKDLQLTNLIEGEGGKYNRQEYDKLYIPNGAIYIIDIEEFLRIENLYTDKTFAYIMSKEKSIDIDDKYDFLYAETVAKSIER